MLNWNSTSAQTFCHGLEHCMVCSLFYFVVCFLLCFASCYCVYPLCSIYHLCHTVASTPAQHHPDPCVSPTHHILSFLPPQLRPLFVCCHHCFSVPSVFFPFFIRFSNKAQLSFRHLFFFSYSFLFNHKTQIVFLWENTEKTWTIQLKRVMFSFSKC